MYTYSLTIVYTHPRVEVVMQEPSKISTTPAWHLTTRKTAENSDKGIADAAASQHPATRHASTRLTATSRDLTARRTATNHRTADRRSRGAC